MDSDTSKSKQIARIEKRLNDPTLPPKQAAALERTLGLLTGRIKTYQKSKSQPKKLEPKLPDWLDEDWKKVFIAERACGSNEFFGVNKTHPFSKIEQAMDEFEIEWAASLGLTVPELYKQLRAEDAERKAAATIGGTAQPASQDAGLPTAINAPTDPRVAWSPENAATNYPPTKSF